MNEPYSSVAHTKLKVILIVAFVAIIQVLKFCVTDVITLIRINIDYKYSYLSSRNFDEKDSSLLGCDDSSHVLKDCKSASSG